MTKVEELREIIEAINEQCEKDLPYQTGLMKDVDLLIAAAETCGVERVCTEASVGKIRVVFVDVRNPILPEYSHIDPRVRVQWKENPPPFDIEKTDLLLIPIPRRADNAND